MLKVQWLYTKFKAGQGGILGDDMGLGKTVQSIALVSAVLQKTGEFARTRAYTARGIWPKRRQGTGGCCPALLFFAERNAVEEWKRWDADVVGWPAAISCCSCGFYLCLVRRGSPGLCAMLTCERHYLGEDVLRFK